MKKVVDEHGIMSLVRTPNMQQILTFCYAKMPIIAILEGKSLEMAYEQAISDYLKSAYKNPLNTQWVKILLEETGVEGITGHAFDVASKLILNSKIVKK
jgi:hypothetical protein